MPRQCDLQWQHSYASHSLKHIFNVHDLDLLAVAKSFGFTVPPKVRQVKKNDYQISGILTDFAQVHLAMENAKGGGRNRTSGAQTKGSKMNQKASGHKFSAANPYGEKQAGDKRQFAH